jgi:Sulfotransferase domain
MPDYQGAGMNLEVIGASFGRTGTMSMKAALEELGFGPCYHMKELFRNPEHMGQWRAAMRGDPVDWERVLGDYRATVDWPGCTFYGELLEMNPDAKVILTVRDPQRWYESVRDTIYRTSGAYYSVAFRLAGLVTPRARRLIRASRFVSELVWEGDFDGRFGDRGHAIETFERHNEEVKRRVPPGRLLVYEVKQGWGPLCDFLGVEVPDKPFPHLNDGEAYRGWVRRVRLFTAAALAVGVSLAGLAVLRLGRRLRR